MCKDLKHTLGDAGKQTRVQNCKPVVVKLLSVQLVANLYIYIWLQNHKIVKFAYMSIAICLLSSLLIIIFTFNFYMSLYLQFMYRMIFKLDVSFQAICKISSQMIVLNSMLGFNLDVRFQARSRFQTKCLVSSQMIGFQLDARFQARSQDSSQMLGLNQMRGFKLDVRFQAR